MSVGYLLAVFAVMGLVSFAERAFPFALSDWLQSHPWVRRLGEFLPLAIMVLLVAQASWGTAQEGAIPWLALSAVALTALIQWWGKSALISIAVGTAYYVAMSNGGLEALGLI